MKLAKVFSIALFTFFISISLNVLAHDMEIYSHDDLDIVRPGDQLKVKFHWHKTWWGNFWVRIQWQGPGGLPKEKFTQFHLDQGDENTYAWKIPCDVYQGPGVGVLGSQITVTYYRNTSFGNEDNDHKASVTLLALPEDNNLPPNTEKDLYIVCSGGDPIIQVKNPRDNLTVEDLYELAELNALDAVSAELPEDRDIAWYASYNDALFQLNSLDVGLKYDGPIKEGVSLLYVAAKNKKECMPDGLSGKYVVNPKATQVVKLPKSVWQDPQFNYLLYNDESVCNELQCNIPGVVNFPLSNDIVDAFGLMLNTFPGTEVGVGDVSWYHLPDVNDLSTKNKDFMTIGFRKNLLGNEVKDRLVCSSDLVGGHYVSSGIEGRYYMAEVPVVFHYGFPDPITGEEVSGRDTCYYPLIIHLMVETALFDLPDLFPELPSVNCEMIVQATKAAGMYYDRFEKNDASYEALNLDSTILATDYFVLDANRFKEIEIGGDLYTQEQITEIGTQLFDYKWEPSEYLVDPSSLTTELKIPSNSFEAELEFNLSVAIKGTGVYVPVGTAKIKVLSDLAWYEGVWHWIKRVFSPDNSKELDLSESDDTIVGNNISLTDDEKSIESIDLYPNPSVQGNVNINGAIGCKLLMVNSIGQVLRSEMITSNSYKKSWSGLKSGVYFVNIIRGNSEVKTFKWIVTKND